MGQKRDQDPLQEWGAEAAVVILVAGLLGGVAIVIYAVMQRGSVQAALLPAAGVAAAGCLVAAGIMRVRKQRERASRPTWMGHTQEWRDEMISRRPSPPPSSEEKEN